MSYTVTEKAERPAGKGSGKCFYCRAAVGEEHKISEQCPLVAQKIIARLELNFETWMPAGRNAEEYFQQRNEGSNCLDNDIDIAIEWLEKLRESGGCGCDCATVYLVELVGEPYLDED